MQGHALIFGEVLFDCFPDGERVLGGAPFNVAWHLQGLGLSPLFVSSVGDDDYGQQVRSTMQSWGMSLRGLQQNQSHDTGRVRVQFVDGQPAYEIVEDQAYDHIDYAQILAAIGNLSPSLIYHGSLIARGEHNRRVLQQLLQQYDAPVFMDINLRPPWWQKSLLQELLKRATWVKLNDEELAILTGLEISVGSGEQLELAAKQLCAEYALDLLIVTLGAQGAFCVQGDTLLRGNPVKTEVVDTVGAGDSFSALMIAGLAQGWSLQQSLDKALQFAARVCQQQGATSPDTELYQGI